MSQYKPSIPRMQNPPPPPEKKDIGPRIPGTRYKVGSKKEYTIYDGDEKKYYKYKKGLSFIKLLKSIFK